MSDFEFIVERLNEHGQAEAWLATAGNMQDARTLFGTMAALHPGQWIMLRQRAYVIASTRRAQAPERGRERPPSTGTRLAGPEFAASEAKPRFADGAPAGAVPAPRNPAFHGSVATRNLFR